MIRHARPSRVYFNDKKETYPTESLLWKATNLVSFTKWLGMKTLNIESKYKLWPGMHYKLLCGIVSHNQGGEVKKVVEVGTGGGMSARCMAHHLQEGGSIHTFDILDNAKFASNKVVAHKADLTKMENIERYRDILESADFIFIDISHNGKDEQKLVDNFKQISIKDGTLFMFDDIRLEGMIDFWYNIDMPKLDITSFGHWSGTGLVEWRNDAL